MSRPTSPFKAICGTASPSPSWGSVAYTDKLMNLNPQHLGYYTFPAGIVLKLPDPVENVNDAMPPWKQVAG